LYIFSLECFWSWEVFNVLLIIPVIWRGFDILEARSFSFWHEIEKPRQIKVSLRSVILLFITVFYVSFGALPSEANVFVLLLKKLYLYLKNVHKVRKPPQARENPRCRV
jgi:hypothetical protein